MIHKLMDRGTHQAFGIVRNADDFLDRVVGELKKIEAGSLKFEDFSVSYYTQA